MVLYMSSGYFFYDFMAMGYYGLLDWTMTVHHWCCIVGLAAALMQDTGANFAVMGMFVAEVSNPTMQLRTMLKHYGLRYTKSYEAMEISFLLMYVFGRYLNGTSLTWALCRCQSNSLPIKLAGFAVLL